LRYKPSAADLQDNPGHHDENTPLLLGEEDEDEEYGHETISRVLPKHRKRSGTTGSGDTSDSYRSRGDLFPSDGEGDEDAVPLDDEFTLPMERTDDRSSNKTRSSKGKRRAGSRVISRTMSRTTVTSQNSTESMRLAGGERMPYQDGPRVEQEELTPATDKEASRIPSETAKVHDIEIEAEEAGDANATHDLEPEPIPPQPEQSPCHEPLKSPTPPLEQNRDIKPILEMFPKHPSEQKPETQTPILEPAPERPPEFVPARLPSFT